MKAKSSSLILFHLFVLQSLSIICSSSEFDYFYFVQQWPGSYCDTKRSCCYPTTGKPAEDFSIHGLWPQNQDGSYPSNCDSTSTFDRSEISDLVRRLQKDWPTLACPSGDGFKFWTHEWLKHGTCSESILDQHNYFKSALDLKDKANLLQALNGAGIRPGKFYSTRSIKEAIREAVGAEAEIECNVDPSGNQQLYQVYLCVDRSTLGFIDCSARQLHGRRRCGSEIEFPSFSSSSESESESESESLRGL